MIYIREFSQYVEKPKKPITLLIKDKNGSVIASIYVDGDMLGEIRKTIKAALMSHPVFHQYTPGKRFYDIRTVSTPQGQIYTEYVAMMPNNITVLHRIVYKALADGHVVDNAQDLLDYLKRNTDLFKPTNKFFWSLYTTVSGKSDLGQQKESDAEVFFTEYAKSKGINVQIRRPATKQEDALESIDLMFNHNGKDFTIQVKTLDNVSETILDGVEYYKVVISGDYTEMKTDYFVVMSVDNLKPSYIFRGKGVITMEGHYLVPKTNFVHKA